MAYTLPILTGLQAAYNAIATKDPGNIYIATDTGKMFLGDIPIGGMDLGKLVRQVDFNETTQVFTITYTDNTTATVDLPLESVIRDISYDDDTKILTFTLVSGATTDISLADLIDVYHGEETDTASVSIDSGEIIVDVKVSEGSGNALIVENDGLFVSTPKAATGKVVVGTGTGIGDSNRGIISEITSETNDADIPDVEAVVKALAIGTF